MKIAVSTDCFNVFTSGYPVRGMMLELVKRRKNDQFVFFYIKRTPNPELLPFFREINTLPNVEVRVLPWCKKLIGLMRLLGLSYYLYLGSDFDLFLNPGNQEIISSFCGKQLFCVPDLAVVKKQVTSKYDNWLFVKLYIRTLKKQLKQVDKIIAISEFTRKDIIETFPDIQTSQKIEVIYNGIDNFWFTKDYVFNRVTDQFRKMDYFIWWGMISRRKNIRLLIEAYKELIKQKKIRTKLLIVGDILPQELSILNEFDDHILYLPFQDELTIKTLVFYSKGLIFPSLYEGFGLPIIEAYSQGKPAAYSNITSLPEVANGYGIGFDPLDIKDMQRAILSLNSLKYDSYRLQEYASDFKYSSAAEKYDLLIESFRTSQ